MQCFLCGEQMQVVRVEPHVVDLRGFELRTFQCVGCGDLEKHPVFDSTLAQHPDAPVPEAARPPAPPMPAARSRVMSLIGGLVRRRSTPHA